MNAQTAATESLPQKTKCSKLDKGKEGLNVYQFNIKIPKVANKEIPMHNFGTTFDHFSLPKGKRCGSRIWRLEQQQREFKSQEQARRSSHNRPVHLLREYLERKERKHTMISVLTIADPERSQWYSSHPNDLVRTANEFRIKRAQKNIPDYGLEYQPEGAGEWTGEAARLEKTDKDFSASNSKNMYEMTVEELRESIRWKKQFLTMLDQKQRKMRGRNYSYGTEL